MWSIWPQAVVWIDGSFVSLMEDRAPNDVDLVILVRDAENSEKQEVASRGLLTMSEVQFKVNGKELSSPKLQPYAGLIDAYYADAKHNETVEGWRRDWTIIRDAKDQPDFTRRKGFLEVTNNG
jgi:hypothetical protein